MKNLNDFITEEDKKKKETRPVQKEKGKRIQKDGADDKEYLRLMSQYKMARRTEGKKANDILEQAFKLSEKGEVSQNALVAAAYM